MNTITRNLGKGLLIVVPLVVTVYVVYAIFTFFDGLIYNLFPDDYYIPIGGGFILTILAIILIGYLGSSIFFRWFFTFTEKLFVRIPLLKLLYTSTKDLIGAFVGDKKKFDKPVLVTVIPGGSAKVLGFITHQDLGHLGINEHVAVYIPQSFNFAGNLFIFPKDQVEPLKIDSSEIMTFILSAGVAAGGK